MFRPKYSVLLRCPKNISSSYISGPNHAVNLRQKKQTSLIQTQPRLPTTICQQGKLVKKSEFSRRYRIQIKSFRYFCCSNRYHSEGRGGYRRHENDDRADEEGGEETDDQRPPPSGLERSREPVASIDNDEFPRRKAGDQPTRPRYCSSIILILIPISNLCSIF